MAIPPLLPIEMNFLKAYIHPLAMKGEFKFCGWRFTFLKVYSTVSVILNLPGYSIEAISSFFRSSKTILTVINPGLSKTN